MRSERARLSALGDTLNEAPEAVYGALKAAGKKPYSIKTMFIRLCALEKWIGKDEVFRRFMDKHQNRFKHAYQREELEITYDEALHKINSELAGDHRAMALSLLRTGVRLSESYKVRDGKVEGKGGKIRKVYGKIEAVVPRSSFARKLKAVSLKPHTLRKLCATKLAEKGATAADLCKVFGWSSITTSYQYLQGREDSRLEAFVEESTKGA